MAAVSMVAVWRLCTAGHRPRLCGRTCCSAVYGGRPAAGKPNPKLRDRKSAEKHTMAGGQR